MSYQDITVGINQSTNSELNIVDDNEDLTTETSYGVSSTALYATSDLEDTDVTLTANISNKVYTDTIKYRLLNVGDFKYDLFTPIYDKNKMDVSRTVNGEYITLNIKLYYTIEASVENPAYLMSLVYPNTVFIKATSMDSDFSIMKADDESALAIIALNTLEENVEYSFNINIRNQLLNKNEKIDGAYIDYNDMFEQVILEIDGGTPFDD